MEILKLSEYQQLIINDDNITYIRTDFIPEEYRNQIFMFGELKRVLYKPMEIDWMNSFIVSIIGFIITFGCGGPFIEGESARMVLIFSKSSRYLDTGELSVKEIKIVVSKVNTAIKNWKRNKENLQ